ncbi:TRAP-type C4-dicarboxylate transport system, periplasmic component [Hoeflea sp. IMCC20628]|uniref:TRAP transporter substrate-binding protein DctP n=1 Tax=Hoeflea sp. IMCC20628 TaxID=1620421 RepID=UPI00063BE6A4|nr:TRAP transporter substrate-binding protein DctP [Hoeflea sp. IMCC20628]AKI02006.1 TRAP-type C4-dicarboxylate transport system, periplasmic component [Hoeflea sp. IMCC20628]
MKDSKQGIHNITRRTLLAVSGAALATPALSRVAFAQDKKVIRISTPAANEEWQAKGLMKFKEQVEANAPSLEVQVHLNATLFDQGTETAAMQRGNLEVGMISPQDVASYIPEYSIFTAGYLLRDAAHLHKVFDDSDVAKEYRDRVSSEMDVTILGSQYLGTRHVILREAKDVKAPADLAGLKLRVPGSDTWQFLGSALGANPTPIAFDEVYLALSTGTVDGLENPIADMLAAKFYEVSEQLVLTAHMVAPLFFAMSNSFWSELTEEEKKVVSDAVAAQSAFVDEGTMATEAEGTSLLESNGLKVTTPDLEAFRKHVQGVYLESDYAKAWPEGLIDRINAL